MNHVFQVEKQDIYQIRYTQIELAELQEGEVRLKIDKYGLTTNNITYAVSGVKLKYWDFYPTEEPFGIIPVWGFGEVVASRSSEIKVGERYYGYFPMATYCTLQPRNIKAFGFSDGAAHRQELAPVYNHYIRVLDNPSQAAAAEDYFPIIKPLFATSFLLYHFFKQQDFLGATQIILTSASSKTSLALAFMLKHNQATDGKRIIGLTSEQNIDFVQSTGYYDTVLTYDNYGEIPTQQSVVVDISGNYGGLENISNLLNDKLLHIALVGLTDWKSAGRFSNIPNTKFFFAPNHFKTFYKEHGAEKANQMLNEALLQFIDEAREMMELEVVDNQEQLTQLYLEMVDGKVNPRKGYLVKI